MINKALLTERFENISKLYTSKKVKDECQNSIKNIITCNDDKWIIENLKNIVEYASSTIMRKEAKDILKNIKEFEVENKKENKKTIERIWAIKNIRNADKGYLEYDNIHIKTFFKNLTDEKNETLKKAEKRNNIFTSDYKLEHVYIDIFENGVYFKLEGCQVKFNIYCDFNGEIKRKQNTGKLIKEISANNY